MNIAKTSGVVQFLQYAISIFPYILDLIIRVPYNINACFMGVIYCGSSEQLNGFSFNSLFRVKEIGYSENEVKLVSQKSIKF